MKRLTYKKNGWIGTEDKKYAFYLSEHGLTIAVKKTLSDEYEKVTVHNLDALKEAIAEYENAINATGEKKDE